MPNELSRNGKDRLPIRQAIRSAHDGPLREALLRRFDDADVITHAAALAFYAVLSLSPLLLLALWITASHAGAQSAVLEQIHLLAGPEARNLADTIIGNARDKPDTGSIAGWWSLGLLLFGASAVFVKLQDALNRIFRTDSERLGGVMAWLRKRVLSFGIVLALGFLLVVSMLLATALDLTLRQLHVMQPVITLISSLVLYTIAFALMYQYLPDRRVRWRMALIGGGFTAALFVLGRVAIAWYLQRASAAAAYGAMGALVMTMLWVFYASMILFAGAVVTATINERLTPSRTQPEPIRVR